MLLLIQRRVAPGVLLLFALSVVLAGGCATSTPEPQTEPRATDQPSAPASATHSEWSGGGRLQLDGQSFELPADPGMILEIHPDRLLDTVDRAVGLVGRMSRLDLSVRSWLAPMAKSAWPRLLPRIVASLRRRPGGLSYLAEELLEDPRSRLFEVRMDHFDTSRPMALVVGTGRGRARYLGRRLGVQLPGANRKSGIVYRLILPATDPDALAEEFGTVCRRAQADKLARLRREAEERGLSDREVEEVVERNAGMPKLCGNVYAMETRGDYLVADIIHFDRLETTAREAFPTVELQEARDKPVRPTPALRHLEQSDRAVSLLITSRASHRLAGRGSWPLSTGAYEFEDIAISMGGDGEGGFLVDSVQSYTELGRRVERAGRLKRSVPEVELDEPILEFTRVWQLRQAAEAAVMPRPPFEPLELSEPSWETFHRLTAMPTGSLLRAWSEADGYSRKNESIARYALSPSVFRLAVGSRGDGSAIPAAGYVEMKPDFADYVERDLKELYDHWATYAEPAWDWSQPKKRGDRRGRVRVGPVGEDAFGQPVEPRQSLRMEADLTGIAEAFAPHPAGLFDFDLAMIQQRIDRYRREAEEAEGYDRRRNRERAASLEEELDEERRRARSRWARLKRAMEELASLSLTSRVGGKARLSRLHVGPGSPSPLDEPEGAAPIWAPEPPPECYHRVIELADELPDGRMPRSFRLEPNDPDELERIRRRLSTQRAWFSETSDEIAQWAGRCDGLSRARRHDLELVRAGFQSDYAELLLKRLELESARQQLEEACRLGREASCRVAELVGSVTLPRTPHAHAVAPLGLEVRFAGPGGVSLGDDYLYDWPDFREVDLRERGDYSDREPLGRLVEVTEPVGGLRWSPPREVIALYADADLPVGHLVRMFEHIEAAHEDGKRPAVGVAVDRGSSSEIPRGWQFFEGRRADKPGATLRVTDERFEVRVGGESLGSTDGPQPGALADLLARAADRDEGPNPMHLQIVAAANTPLSEVTRLVSTALVVTSEQRGRRQTVDMLFDTFFLDALP